MSDIGISKNGPALLYLKGLYSRGKRRTVSSSFSSFVANEKKNYDFFRNFHVMKVVIDFFIIKKDRISGHRGERYAVSKFIPSVFRGSNKETEGEI